MKIQAHSLILLGLVSGLILLSTGCHSRTIPVGGLPSSTLTTSNLIPTVSPTVENTPTITPTPTNMPRPTQTITTTPSPTSTPLPTSTLTWTPQPTLPPDQAHAFALNMIKTNGGCLFPCWLGIVPGQAQTVEALASLAPFADRIIPGGLYSFRNVYFILSEPLGGEKEFSAGLSDENGIVTVIETFMPISLADLLSTYGPPSEVLIHAIGWSTLGKEGRFLMVLIYPKKGIMALYFGPVALGKTLYISPNHFDNPQLTGLLLWSPTREMTFAEGGRRLGIITDPPPPGEKDYLPLEKVTNLSIQAFYQRYKDPQNSGLYFFMEAPDYPKDMP
jgi:hypothetical protein